MPVVSNTSPLLNLAIIGNLSLLKKQFGQVFIPKAVFEECRLDEHLPGADQIADAIQQGWVVVKDVSDRSQVKLLERELDKGEAEAIVCARELNADIVLLDERDARRVGKALGLTMTGVLGILLKAHRDGHCDSIEHALTDLREKAGFYINDTLYAEILEFSKHRKI